MWSISKKHQQIYEDIIKIIDSNDGLADVC